MRKARLLFVAFLVTGGGGYVVAFFAVQIAMNSAQAMLLALLGGGIYGWFSGKYFGRRYSQLDAENST